MSGFLPELDGLSVEALADLMQREPTEPGMSPAAYYEEVASDLLRHGGPGREVVASYLDHPLTAQRTAAIAALSGEDGSPEVAEAALRALEDEDPVLVMTAIDVLRRLGSPDLPDRVGAFAAHPSPLVRGAVMRYLSARGDDESIDSLLAALVDSDPIVRQSAAEGLAEAGAQSATEALASLRQDPHPGVRAAVEYALGSLAAQADDPRG